MTTASASWTPQAFRRKGKTTLMAEKLSVIMARKHLEAADVALLVIDATEGVTGLDANIGGYAHESGRSVIIVVNKWDEVTTGRLRPDGKDDYEDGKATRGHQGLHRAGAPCPQIP